MTPGHPPGELVLEGGGCQPAGVPPALCGAGRIGMGIGVSFSFQDSHDTLCGCPEVSDTCRAVSAGLAPPPALDPLPGGP